MTQASIAKPAIRSRWYRRPIAAMALTAIVAAKMAKSDEAGNPEESR